MLAETFELKGHTCPTFARQGRYTGAAHEKEFFFSFTEGVFAIAPFWSMLHRVFFWQKRFRTDMLLQGTTGQPKISENSWES